MEVLQTRVGEGITGFVAATGQPFLRTTRPGSALGVHIAGTARIEESLVAVPLLYGTTAVGVIVVSKLGLDQFDQDELRLLEVLAGHASTRARQRAALRGAAPRGRERKGAARAVLRALVEHGARCGRRRGSRRARRGSCGPNAPRSGCREHETGVPRVLRDVAARPRASVLARGRRLPESLERLLAASSEPFLMTREDLLEHLVDADERGLRHGGRRRLSRGSRDRARSRSPSLACRAGRPAARAPRRDRRAGAAGGLERALVPGPRAVVPLDDRGARERARGERRVHLLPCALDLRRGAPGRRGARPHARRAEAPGAGGALPRPRQDRVPAAILRKPGPLTPEEQAVIERHPELGERILAPLEQFADVLTGHPRLPRVLRRHGLPRPARGRRHPARGADHLRLRRVPRHDERPPVPVGAARPPRRCAVSQTPPGRSSTLASSRCSSASWRATARR